MDDPFGDLRRKREEQENGLRKEKEKEEQKREKRIQRIEQLRESYNEIVMGIMEQLRQAAYPKERLYSRDVFWSIGHNIRDEGTDYWYSEVNVKLILNSNDNPVRFECFDNSGELKTTAGLSGEELIAALRKLIERKESPTGGRSWLERLLGG